jgi:hypothetical protein
MTSKDKASQNELEVLKGIANVGWLTTRLVAHWVWMDSREHVAVNKAQLVLRRLEEKGQVLARVTLAGPKAWVLTSAGAERVNDAAIQAGYARGWAHHGYDISTMQHQKQLIVVSHLTKLRKAGLAAVGKAGLRAGLVDARLVNLDGVAVDVNSGKRTGFLFVFNAAESTLARVAHFRKLGALELLGDPRIIRTIHRKLSA